MSRHDDRGLVAVRRVREVRERDSRLGLQQAIAATARRQEDADAARARLDTAPAFGSGTAEEFRAHTLLLRSLADASAEKDAEVRRSASVADEARRRWSHDKQSLRTAELLLERRESDRRTEQVRREARDLDELATQGWLRGVAAARPAVREVRA